MNELVQAVCDDPVSVLHDSSRAADQLVAAGGASVPLIAEALRSDLSSQAHPIDIVEALGQILARIAVKDRAAVAALLSDESIKGDKSLVEWALESAEAKRSPK